MKLKESTYRRIISKSAKILSEYSTTAGNDKSFNSSPHPDRVTISRELLRRILENSIRSSSEDASS